MNKFFMRFNKSLQESHSSIGSATALLQGKRGYSRLRCGILIKFPFEEIVSYESFNARKKKSQYRRAIYKKSIRFAIKFFVLRVTQFKKAKDFYTTSYLQEQRSVCPKPRITFFFGSRVLGFRSDPSWLKYWLLPDLVYEEAMCKGSTGNGLLNAAKAVP